MLVTDEPGHRGMNDTTPARRRRLIAVAAVVSAALAVVAAQAQPAGATAFINWPGYLYGSSHSSASPATAITPANAANLKRVWGWRCAAPTITGQPNAGFVASPSVYNGTIYIGCNTGIFYALNETTGAVEWTQMLGYVTKTTCAARGVSSTASIAIDPVTGNPTVYVAGGDGYLYALDAATGTVVWKSVIGLPSPTQNDFYDWSSPAIANGMVYIGVSSQCDKPLVAGAGLKAYSLGSGALLGTYLTLPAPELGGSIWSSPAVDSHGAAFVTIGNDLPGALSPGDSSSIVSLNATTLARTGGWRIPPSQQVEDNDWAASPTVFTATINGTPTELVTACNKNGFLYAFNAASITPGPVWDFQVGAGTGNGVLSCLGAAIWNGANLFEPGNATTINGTAYNGSMRELDPATGTPIWQTGLPGIILGSPSMDAAGVIAASTYGGTVNGTYLLNATTGAILKLIGLGKEFSQPVFADGFLILATQGGGINVYTPK
jgi:outer membrane protein assembly factor BamB